MTLPISPTRNAIVSLSGGKPMATSRDVASLFGKRHDNVLRAYAAMECSAEFNALNFEAVDYVDAKGERRGAINMTKDGFVFLVMGFTGPAAARFKERRACVGLVDALGMPDEEAAQFCTAMGT